MDLKRILPLHSYTETDNTYVFFQSFSPSHVYTFIVQNGYYLCIRTPQRILHLFFTLIFTFKILHAYCPKLILPLHSYTTTDITFDFLTSISTFDFLHVNQSIDSQQGAGGRGRRPLTKHEDGQG